MFKISFTLIYMVLFVFSLGSVVFGTPVETFDSGIVSIEPYGNQWKVVCGDSSIYYISSLQNIDEKKVCLVYPDAPSKFQGTWVSWDINQSRWVSSTIRSWKIFFQGNANQPVQIEIVNQDKPRCVDGAVPSRIEARLHVEMVDIEAQTFSAKVAEITSKFPRTGVWCSHSLSSWEAELHFLEYDGVLYGTDSQRMSLREAKYNCRWWTDGFGKNFECLLDDIQYPEGWPVSSRLPIVLMSVTSEYEWNSQTKTSPVYHDPGYSLYDPSICWESKEHPICQKVFERPSL